MTTVAWIFMTAVWATILVAAIVAFRIILKSKQRSQHDNRNLDIYNDSNANCVHKFNKGVI